MSDPATELRPRFGQITRQSGDEVPVMFEPTDDPTVFCGVLLDGGTARIYPGDSLSVDVIGPGQAVAFESEEGSRP